MCVYIFSTILSETFLILRRIQRDGIKKIHWSSCKIPVKGKGLPQQAEVAQGVSGRLRPRIFLTFGTTRVVGRQPYAPAAFTPRRNPWYSFLEAESTPEHMVPKSPLLLWNFNETWILDRFSKNDIKFHENPSIWEPSCSVRTDGGTSRSR
jgi:hypothetical protein